MIAAESRTQPRGTRRHSRSLAQLERDAALHRVGHARRWLIAGAAGLTAAVVGVVSAVAPGRSLGAGRYSAAAASAAAPSNPTQMPPLASPSSLGLQGPRQAPQGDGGSPGPSAASQANAAASQSNAAASPSQVSPAAAPSPAQSPVTSGGS